MLKDVSLRAKLTLAFFLLSTAVAGAGLYYPIDHADDENNFFALILAGAVVFAATMIGLLVSGRVSSTIAAIKAGAERFANGDFSQRLPVRSNDELGQLAAYFNQMSDRLQESYQRLAIENHRDEAILQSMGEGLIAVDEQARVVLLNNNAVDLLDINSPKELVDKTIYPSFHLQTPDQKDAAILALEQTPPFQTLKTGTSVNGVFAFTKTSGSQIMLNVGANPITINEKVVGAILVLRDVTHEKEVDRMKTEFISLASHQLRTPLSAIKWYNEMLLSGDAGELQPDQVEFAKNVADSTERMIQLVNSLLNISRIESGRIVVDPKPTDLKELVAGIVSDLKGKTEEKQQTLVISIHDDLPKINLDPRLIGQVYLNLLTNAIKYTQKGGEISVFVSKKDDQVISQVTDNGFGIPKDQQTHLFQKFFRASNAIKVETDGTGLGLYLIKAIVESSGGKIWFKSEQDKGSTFWFSIPLSGMQPKEGEVTLDV